MMIPLIDVILLIILSGFVFYGLFFGIIRTAGLFVGVIIATFFASRLYLPASGWVDGLFAGYDNLGRVLVFLILFIIINRLVGLAFYIIDRFFCVFSIIPFVKTANRLGGAALGLITGSFFLGVILYVISKYALLDVWIGQWLVDSRLAPVFLKWARLALPLLPEMLKKLNSII